MFFRRKINFWKNLRGIVMTSGRTLAKFWVLIIISAFASKAALAQDLAETYSKFLPKKYIVNEYEHGQLSKLLKAKSRIHPDLIYYYITYYQVLNNWNNDLEGTGAGVYKEFRTSIENGLLQKRNAWAGRQIALLDTLKAVPEEVKSRANEIFSSLKTPLISSSSSLQNSFPADESLLNYFALLYYNPGEYSQYLSDLSYSGSRKKEEEKLKDRILTLYGAAQRKNAKENAELINLITDRWYLFDSSSALQPGEMVAGLLKEDNALLFKHRFSIGISYSPFNNACLLNPSIFIKGLKGTQEFEIRQAVPQAGLTLGYKYYFKNVSGPFSFVSFQALYFTGISSKAASAPLGFKKDYENAASKFHEELNFRKSEITPKSVQSAFLKVTTPVLLLSKAFEVQCGMIAGVNKMKYEFEYDYSYVKTEGYYTGNFWEQTWYTRTVALGAEKKSVEDTNSKTILSPAIEMYFNSMEMVSMNISLTLHYAAFSVLLEI